MFYCQRECYSKELDCEVVDCKPAKRKLEVNGKKSDVAGFEVLFSDTVFFPEGGGQNTDKGSVEFEGKNVNVLDVSRKGEKAVHFLDSSLPVGARVNQKIDWDRRFDAMQQHSGQHLISAILEKHGIKTLSWWMAENSQDKVGFSYIGLDKPVPSELKDHVEWECNTAIRDFIPVTVHMFDHGDPQLEKIDLSSLPEDSAGPVRLVQIGDVDNNVCCGTHVSNTAHLQAVKLLHTESKKGKEFLYFLVGDRVMRYLGQTLHRERAITDILKNGPESHVDLVDKMQKSLSSVQKINSSLLKELAVEDAHKLINADPQPPFGYFYKKEGDNDYVSTLLRELQSYQSLIVILTGDGKVGSGQLVVYGQPSQADLIAKVAKGLCDLLDGKGGGKGQRYNAKLTNFKQIGQAEQLVSSLFSE